MNEAVNFSCPYCEETFETTVDLSHGDQDYIEVCYVCCRPVQFEINVEKFKVKSVSSNSSIDLTSTVRLKKASF